MDNDLNYERLHQIQAELDVLRENSVGPCDCENYVEIKIRSFGGGKHYVKQCNACGEQRGGSLKTADALALLDGVSPREFDPSIEEDRRTKSRMLNEQVCERLDEASRLKIMLYEEPDLRALQLFEREEHELAAARLAENVDSLVEQFGVTHAIRFLVRETVRLKKRAHDEFIQDVNRFSSEAELKSWFEINFSKDFHIASEVEGRHLAENVPVRIDYVLKARQHLLDVGFDRRPFGVEVKFFRQEDGFTHKTSRGVWQTISYNDCEFNLEGDRVKPKFSLLFSNLSFEQELQLVNSFGHEFENDKFEWIGMIHLANHANVGSLNVKGTRDSFRGWGMEFAGGVYFSCGIWHGRSTYSKSNENIINKVRIGNF